MSFQNLPVILKAPVQANRIHRICGLRDFKVNIRTIEHLFKKMPFNETTSGRKTIKRDFDKYESPKTLNIQQSFTDITLRVSQNSSNANNL